MSGRMITICDNCGKEHVMPTSWSNEDNPYRGWFHFSYHGKESKDICPNCLSKLFSEQLVTFLQRFWKG